MAEKCRQLAEAMLKTAAVVGRAVGSGNETKLGPDSREF